jgi:general secretion pathway protein H
MSPIERKAASQAGFTLIEMMAVMLIVALVSSLVVTLTPGSGRAELKSVVMQTEALLRRERVQAILSGRERRVSLDAVRRVLAGESGETVSIPRDVAIGVLGTDAQWSGGQAVVLFRADGASSGAVLKFARERVVYEVRVNWYTGGISVAAL